MNTNFKKITRLLFLFATLLTVSCSEDLYEHESHKNESGFKITEKTFEELSKEKKFIKAYAELNALKSSSSKTIMEQNYNFTISDVPAKVIEKNGKTSYTFHIERDTVNFGYFENLIVGSDSLNQTTAYIAKYKKDFSTPSFINNIPYKTVTFSPIIYNNSQTSKVMECVTKVYSLCTGNPYDCGGAICGFSSFTYCSGGGGPSGGTGVSWQGGGTATTPVGGGGGSASSNMDKFITSLGFNQQEWFGNQSSETQQSVFNYLNTNGFTFQNKNFIKQLISYAISNPNITWEQIQNWFLTPREGRDGDYDESFWENPNLNFPQQSLPTFQAFDTAYPRADGASLIQLIGGDVLTAYTNNPNDVRGFCALKVSRGLNGANITIPNLPGKTIKGGDNKYYFLNAKALNKWMRKTFGVNPLNSNHLHLTAAQGGVNGVNFPSLTANIKGIFSMVTNDPNHTWASGHADLINNGNCVFGCHFNDVPASILDYIDIWILN